MAKKDIINPVDVNNPSTTRRSADLLPLVHRTDRNAKFLASTLDQYIQQPQIKRVNGYVGSKLTPNYDPILDHYLGSTSKLRSDYQLEPALIISDMNGTIDTALGYDDLVNKLAFNNANVERLDRLFKSTSFSYDPHIDWDKFVNFREYYWLPTGPEVVSVAGQAKQTVSTYKVTDSADGKSLVFTPNGLENNPLLTLYRGLTYVFEIKCSNPFYIKTSYEEGAASLYENVTNNGAVDGQVIVTIDDNTPSTLFYNAEGNQTAIGRISVKHIADNSAIDIESEIIGKKTYVSGNGVTFTNGMKVKFIGDVTPSSYANKTYYIEGVGSKIELVDEESLRPIGKPTTVLDPNFDATLFDQYPFDDFGYIPLTPEYITINRSASNKNQWSRYNRWVHSSVIEATAAINGVAPSYPVEMRAKRPIIEFAGNLQLFNYGVNGKKPVDLIDNRTTDAFKVVEKSSGYAVDGIPLEAGHRVIFNIDNDPSVRGKIYEVKIANINGAMRINLEETVDTLPQVDDAIMVANGIDNIGTAWWYDGNAWIKGQQKTALNQAPMFELYDSDGIRYSDRSIYDGTFEGTKVFGYKLGQSIDPVLGIGLSYRSVSNAGEYEFSNFYTTDTFTTMSGNVTNVNRVADGYLRLNDTSGNAFVTVWTPTSNRQIPIIQYQVIDAEAKYVEITAIDRPGYDNSLDVTVFLNDTKLKRNIDYTLVSEFERAYIVLVDNFLQNDRVLIKITSKQAPTETGYYEVPTSLSNNPLNGDLASFTFSELNDHMKSMADATPDFDGAVNGKNNLRDLSGYERNGSRILSHETPMSFAHYFLGGELDDDLITAIRKVATDYNQFKANLLRHITNIKGTYSPEQALDLVISAMNTDRDNTLSYSHSDMLAHGNDNVARVFVVTDPRTVQYNLVSTFDDTKLSTRSVLVYRNDELLIKDRDYTFSKFEPVVTLSIQLAKGDIITIRDYPNTTGSVVPPTPTKLGLYPKYTPSMYMDDTFAGEPKMVIQGHDGSIMVAYNDYRDAIVLEYEKRVYNNLKTQYDRTLFDINSVMVGAFRDNDFTSAELNDIMSSDFLRWTGYFGVDFQSNTTFDETNTFTFNHTGAIDSIFKRPLNGYWRAVYKLFYDTDRPHMCPWEMLGYTEQPSWWVDAYGPAPYTRGNDIMWADIEAGRNAITGEIDLNYARPGLKDIIPVDDLGNLLSPTECGLATTPIISATDTNRIIMLRNESVSASWQIGDFGPAEMAWRRSSWWPFVAQILAALTQPAAYAALMFDTSRMKRNLVGEWRYGDKNSFISPTNVALFGEIVNGSTTLAAGYSVFLIETGRARDNTYISTLREDLNGISYRLMAKLGGFTSKEKIQVSIDAIDLDSSASGAILSSEDYQIFFNKSNPVETIGVSGFIIQKTASGWTLRGYDKYKPYFTVYPPYQSNNDQVERIGGVSESFVQWEPNTIYDVNQIVFYSDRYYRVKQKHNSDSAFSSVYYQSLPYLPVIGGISIKRRSAYQTDEKIIPYGTEYDDVQSVYDVIVGYGEWLKSKGFVFEEYNQDLAQILDWRFTANEFLYWSTQQWAVNSVITLSPFANKLTFTSNDSVVENVITKYYEYSLLRADGTIFPKQNFSVSRLDGVFEISTVNTQDGLYFAQLNLVQKEHAIVLNNLSMFSDIIYSTETGYRQRRIKLTGFITDNWNGDFFSPGFVFDQAHVSDWTKFTDYKIGDVVRFAGKYYSAIKAVIGSEEFDLTRWNLLAEKPMPRLLPNFEYKINQFEDFYSLDIDNFDANQQAMAQHLIGYTPRPYLNYIVGDSIAQYKFYQGFIREKGTKSPISKLGKASLSKHGSELDFNEEWAFRVGQYGGFNTHQELDFKLTTNSFNENPQIICFSDNAPTINESRISYLTTNDILVKPESFDIANIFGTTNEKVFKLPHAGYVRFDDVVATAFNKNSVLDIANNSALQEGDTVWLGYTENGNWDVLRVTNVPTYINEVELVIPSESLMFTTYYEHQLKVGDLISVKSLSAEVDRCYIVKELVNPNQFIVYTKLTSLTPLAEPIFGSVSVFKTSRLPNYDKLSEIPFLDKWATGEKVWVDSDGTGKWAVYRKGDNYAPTTLNSPSSDVTGQHFGQTIDAIDGSDVVLVASPDHSYTDLISGEQIFGRAFVIRKNTFGDIELMEALSLNDNFGPEYVLNGSPNRFGHSMKYRPSSGLVAIGAPSASNVKQVVTGTVVVNNASTVTSTSSNQGVVKLSLLDDSSYTLLDQSIVITDRDQSAGANYGWAVDMSTPYQSTSTIKLADVTGVVIGNAIQGQHISGTPIVVAIDGNFITTNIPQTINTATSLSFKTSTVAITDVESTNTVRVSTTAGIVINSIISSPYTTPATVTGIGDGYVTLDQNQTINTSTVVTFINATTTGGSYGTNQRILISAPHIDADGIGYVQVLDVDVTVDGIELGDTTKRLNHANTSTTELYGYSVTGDRILNRVAVAAPGNINNSEAIGAIYVYDFMLSEDPIQVITSADLTIPMGETDIFGTKIVMSQDGQYIVVASPYAFDPAVGLKTGVVDVFKWTVGQYVHSQRIGVPVSVISTNTVFGYDISISADNSVLTIGSIGDAAITNPTFDKFSEASGDVYINDSASKERKAKTVFDGNSTMFSHKNHNAGTVHVYNKLGEGSSKWAYAQQLASVDVSDGSMYGSSVVALNDVIVIGAPAKLLSGEEGAKSGVGQVFLFDKKDKTINSWYKYREQEPLVDVVPFSRVITVNDADAQVADYYDIVDPLKGKILSSAQAELRYISQYDPAVYSVGVIGVNVDSTNNWLDEHVGELWWDLSTVKYVWYEQGELEYRKNNWNNIFPGCSIDVYEWVRSEYVPTEWAQIADTPKGLAKGISGQPKFANNSVVSVKQVYDGTTNSFTNVYYYWVKNKVTLPLQSKVRKVSAYQVAQDIANPLRTGNKYIAMISPSALTLANTKPSVTSEQISMSISFDTEVNSAKKHTEWALVMENDTSFNVPDVIVQKMVDSLLGYDGVGNPVPDPSLTDKQRYGVSIRPRQTMFKNRREAVRNVIEAANEIMISERITDQADFTNLNMVDEIPSSDLFDVIVEDQFNLELIDTDQLARAIVSPVVDRNGAIASITIVDPGHGYTRAPMVELVNSTGSGAIFETIIDELGRVIRIDVVKGGKGYNSDLEVRIRPYTVVVRSDRDTNGNWAMYEWNSEQWVKIRTQSYNTPLYWDYVDWASDSYNELNVLVATLDSTFELAVVNQLVEAGSYVKVRNGNNGNYLILEKTDGFGGTYDPDWNVVYAEKGTIQISDFVWNTMNPYGWDEIAGYDGTLYDQTPTRELDFIIKALMNDIFVGNRSIYKSKIFFKVVRYVFSEQKFVDWAFKTTFIGVTNRAGELNQPASYVSSSSVHYEMFLNEIKPYHTKIRTFTEMYTSTEYSNTFNTDFDLPSYYNSVNSTFDKVEFGNELLLQYPWRSWLENYALQIKSITVTDGGAGYAMPPQVEIIPAIGDTGMGATAVAFLRNGSISQILVTNPGQGYTTTPTVVFNGGGNTITRPAKAYAVLGNSPVRSNSVTMKFDRISVLREVGGMYHTEKFPPSDGSTVAYPLTWAPMNDKSQITFLRNGVPQMMDVYTIEFNEQKFAPGNGTNYSKLYATLKLNFVPDRGDILEINYPKSMSYYNAAGRIYDYYAPTAGMPGITIDVDHDTGEQTAGLGQLMAGAEYAGLTVSSLPFDAVGGWDATGIPWSVNPWDNLGKEDGFVSYVTTATTTQTFYIPTVVATGTQLNTYVYSAGSAKGVRLDGTLTIVDTLIGLGTTTIDSVDMVVPGNGYVPNEVSVLVSSPETLNGTAAVLAATVTAGEVAISVIDGGSGYVNPPQITILSTDATATITVPAIARPVMKAEFTSVGSTATVSDITIPEAVFTTTPTLVVFRYDTSDGTSIYDADTEVDAFISGGTMARDVNGLLSTARGVEPSEIVLDGGSTSTRHITGMNDDGFLNPINSYAPEECVPGQVRESLAITLYSEAATQSPTIETSVRYYDGSVTTFALGVRPVNAESVIVVFNNVRLPEDAYVVDYANKTITLTGVSGSGWVSILSMDLGTIRMVDSFYTYTTDASTSFISQTMRYASVGSVYVTVNGIRIADTEYVLDSYAGLARITVNKPGAIQVFFFADEVKSYSEVMRQYPQVIDGQTTYVLDPVPGSAGPHHTQVIVTKNNLRLSPPSTTYWEVLPGQTTFAVTQSANNYAPVAYDTRDLEVYVNGKRVTTRKWTLDRLTGVIQFVTNAVVEGDVVAIVVKGNEDYLVKDGSLVLSAPTVAGDDLCITTFTNHDADFIRTDVFYATDSNRYTIQRAAIDVSYVWVSYAGVTLMPDLDYVIDTGNQTIVVRDGLYKSPADEVVITSFAIQKPSDDGTKLFVDMLGRVRYTNTKADATTVLVEDLKLTDTEIHVENAGVLTYPAADAPGVVFINGERIEFFAISGNVLTQLRRGTLGTGAKLVHVTGTLVVDQGDRQTVSMGDEVQSFVTTVTTATQQYVIPSSDISFDTAVSLVDQVEVKYQGVTLIKPSLTLMKHNYDVSYDSSAEADVELPPMYDIQPHEDGAVVILNPAAVTLVTGSKLAIYKKVSKPKS